MRLLIIDALYPAAEAAIYANTPSLHELPYDHQLSHFIDEAPTSAAYWLGRELQQLYNWECTSIFLNCTKLQRQWAKEYTPHQSDRATMLAILRSQIEYINPDKILVFPISEIPKQALGECCSALTRKPTLFAWDGVGLCNDAIANTYDAFLSCLPHVTSYYRGKAKKAHTLATGFNPRLYARHSHNPRIYPTTFIGSVDLSTTYYERFSLLSRLTQDIDLSMWLNRLPPWKIWQRYQLGLIRSGNFSRAAKLFRLGKGNMGPAFGHEMFRILSQSKITLNHHGYANGISSGNRRLWEATGMGTCLITDWTPGLSDLFKIDEEVVAYRTPDECIEKVQFLLANPATLQAIASAGMNRTHSDYSTAKISQQIAQILVSN